MRDIDTIHCSCGGCPVEVDTAEEEEKEYGCVISGCCVNAYVCPECNTRWTFALKAPEMD